MKSYIYDELPGDQRFDHETHEVLSVEDLARIGVFYDQFLGTDESVLNRINALAAERSYKNRDEITVSPGAMGDVYESKVRMFFDEHLHEDEEIRFVLDGTGFFDVRAKDERWIRIRVEKGDLLILPAGIYHRFTTDQKDYIKAMRLFKEEPKWTPLNRAPELEENPHRKAYVQEVGLKA